MGPEVTKVRFSANKKVQAVSTDPAEDVTPFVYYPLFTTKEVGDDAFDRIRRSRIQELDRLSACIDLVAPVSSAQSKQQRLIFKYTTEGASLDRLWKRAFTLKRLAGCPHLVSFDKFIIDDVEPRFPEFTEIYIPGQTLKENQNPFRKKWLQQLLAFVDNPNLRYGTAHQDVAPRNLIVHEDHLTVIDLDCASAIGSEDESRTSNDIDGVIYTMYEVLTRDLQFREEVMPQDYNIEDITLMDTWPLHLDVMLEPGLDSQTLRSTVMKWANDRRQKIANPKHVLLNVLSFPPMPSRAVEKVIVNGELWYEYETYSLRQMVSTGERIVYWERPSQKKLIRL